MRGWGCGGGSVGNREGVASNSYPIIMNAVFHKYRLRRNNLLSTFHIVCITGLITTSQDPVMFIPSCLPRNCWSIRKVKCLGLVNVLFLGRDGQETPALQTKCVVTTSNVADLHKNKKHYYSCWHVEQISIKNNHC